MVSTVPPYILWPVILRKDESRGGDKGAGAGGADEHSHPPQYTPTRNHHPRWGARSFYPFRSLVLPLFLQSEDHTQYTWGEYGVWEMARCTWGMYAEKSEAGA